jgi:hypothetical protein
MLFFYYLKLNLESINYLSENLQDDEKQTALIDLAHIIYGLFFNF